MIQKNFPLNNKGITIKSFKYLRTNCDLHRQEVLCCRKIEFLIFTCLQQISRTRSDVKCDFPPAGYNKQTKCFVQVYWLAPCYKTHLTLHCFTVSSWLSVNFSISWQDWKKTILNTTSSLATNDVMLPTPKCVLPVFINAQAWGNLWHRQDLTYPEPLKPINSTAPRSSKTINFDTEECQQS
jgi:hypothetical protein